MGRLIFMILNAIYAHNIQLKLNINRKSYAIKKIKIKFERLPTGLADQASARLAPTTYLVTYHCAISDG
jgi:hypothetical protein